MFTLVIETAGYETREEAVADLRKIADKIEAGETGGMGWYIED